MELQLEDWTPQMAGLFQTHFYIRLPMYSLMIIHSLVFTLIFLEKNPPIAHLNIFIGNHMYIILLSV